MQWQIKVWNIPVANDQIIRAATIEHGLRIANPNCDGCIAPCCRAPLSVVLDSSEFLSRKFKFTFRPAPEYITKFAPDGKGEHLMVVVPEVDNHCFYFDPTTNYCKIWPNIPKGCLAYDCREDKRPEISSYVKHCKQQGNWK